MLGIKSDNNKYRKKRRKIHKLTYKKKMLPKRNEDKNYGFIFISSLLPLIINNFLLSLLSVVSMLDKKNVNKKGNKHFHFYIQLRDVF